MRGQQYSIEGPGLFWCLDFVKEADREKISGRWGIDCLDLLSENKNQE